MLQNELFIILWRFELFTQINHTTVHSMIDCRCNAYDRVNGIKHNIRLHTAC